jgi:hypothetical protein
MIQHCFALMGQSNVGSNVDSDLSNLANLKVYALSDFDNRDKSYDGSSLLFETWQAAKIQPTKRDQPIDEIYFINYDLRKKMLLVNGEHKVFTLPTLYLNNFIVFGGSGRTEKYLIINDELGSSLYKEIVDGEVSLLMKPGIRIIQPTYNVALDTGSLRPKIVRKDHKFIKSKGKLYELPKKLKHVKKHLKKTLPGVAKFLLDQKVNLKDDVELQSAIINYNNKIEKNETYK